MAQFALGLTKTAVEGTLSKVKSAIEEEAKLKEKVQHDLVFITGEFQMMQSFLNVANTERAKNEVVRTWVRQLRDLAFDVEDCVEFVVHLDKKSAWWWRVVPSCMAPPQHLDEAAAEIKQLKARVQDVSQRNTRYKLISDSDTHKTVMPAEQPSTANPSTFHILRELWKATGKKRPGMCDLQKLITSEGSDLQVITVWGSTEAHLETTSIFRKAYYDPETCEGFKLRAWVNLTHPFSPDEFLKNLLTQFRASSHQGRMKGPVAMDDELMQQVTEQRYLVILDHVSATVEWDVIKMYLPDSKKGSRIVVSTQDIGIALRCTGEPYQVSELFSYGQPFTVLFKKGAGRRCDVGELIWQLRCRGVFSVLGSGLDLTILLDRTFRRLRDEREESDGLKFEHSGWVRLKGSERAFAENLLREFHSNDQEEEAEAGAEEIMEKADTVERCCKFLREKDCLVVINGLESRDDWDKIKSTFLSELSKGSCIVVYTHDANMATYCADHEYRVLKGQDLMVYYSHKDNKNDRHNSDEEKNYSNKDTEKDEHNSNEGKNYSHNAAEKAGEIWEYFLSSLGKKAASERGPRVKEAHDWLKNFELLPRKKKNFEFFVHEDGRDELWELCEEPPRVLSVWGIAGVGKSFRVRSFYYTNMVHDGKEIYDKNKNFTAYSWVDVPQPFNLKELSWRLLVDFHSDDLEAKEAAIIGMLEGQDPVEGCRKFLREYKCLVVIDGLRSKDDWNSIKAAFLCERTRACIIVITNEASIAKHCASYEDLVINVKGLEADAALKLFKKVAWDNKQLTSREEELSTLILTKCGGLPKIITAIGEGLKENYDLNAHSLEELSRSFMVILETYQISDSLRGLFSWMQSYFNACPDSLKPCIFYLSVFPTNHIIRRRRLLRRWIAESYSRDTSTHTADEYAEKLFSQLLDLSIIQLQHFMCKVNGFFQEYIISRPMEDNLIFALEGHCTNSQRAGQHLTIRDSWDRDEIIFKSIDFSRLRSLTVFGIWKPFFITKCMKLLRVLDLEDTLGLTDDDLEKIGKTLSRLKFLSLRGCTKITRLPNSLGGMRQLQTLDIRHTSIVKLPYVITKLEKLQYIRAGTTRPSIEYWTSTPSGDGEGVGTSLPEEDEDRTLTSAEGGDATGSRQPVAVAPRPVEEVENTCPSQPTAIVPTTSEEGDGTCSSQPTTKDVVWTSTQSRSQPHILVSSLLTKLWRVQRIGNGGVEIPAGIGNLMVLNTLGVVNMSGSGGKAILKELKKLTQLRKLGVSGINRGNIQQLCYAISGHGYLESLSVRVDKDKKGSIISLDGISQPPKTLKKLKLYGHGHKMPVWIKQLDHIEKLDLEMTILTQDDIDILDELPRRDFLCRLCVKPIQDGELHFGPWRTSCPTGITLSLQVLKIDCTSNLEVTFQGWITENVEFLILQCSSGSSLGIFGLKNLWQLKEVWLKGSYSEALKKNLQHQIDELPMYRRRPVLKLEQLLSS